METDRSPEPTPPVSAESGHEAAAAFIANPTSPLTGPVLANMLTGDGEFTEPVHLLRDLTGDQAAAKPEGAAESIAQIVAHMHFWQHRNLAIIHGGTPPYPQDEAAKDATWAEIPPERWQALVSDFLADLDEMIGLTEDPAQLSRQVKDSYTVADMVRYNAVHNAYHFGQIALMRRMQGLWPPEGGENTY